MPHCMSTPLLFNPFNQAYSYMSASEIISDSSRPSVCRQVRVSSKLRCSALVISHALISIHQDLCCNTRAAFQDVTQSGEGSASALLCDPNKRGTWWYPALWSSELKGCLGVYRNPSLSCPQSAKRPAPSNRRKSCKSHWLVLGVLCFFFVFF